MNFVIVVLFVGFNTTRLVRFVRSGTVKTLQVHLKNDYLMLIIVVYFLRLTQFG